MERSTLKGLMMKGRMPSFNLACWMLLAFFLLGSKSLAQSSDEQRALEEQRRIEERQRQQREQFEPSPDIRFELPDRPPVAEPTEETACFPIEHIELDAPDLRPFRRLERQVQGMLEQPNCIGAQGINRIISEAQNELIAAGFVTSRIVAEPQDLTTGVLTLTLLPGYLDEIIFDDDVPGRATYWNAVPVPHHGILNLRDIEQGLENFKRVPSVDANIEITPSEIPGHSDLVIQWEQARPVRLTLTLDDTGSTSTGKYQSSATLSYDPYWAFNDLFYVTYNRAIAGFDDGDRGSQGISGHYSVPFRYWLFAVNAGYNEYLQTISGAVEDYEYSGQNTNQSLRVSRLIHRNARHKTTVHFNTSTRQSRNFINDVEIRVQRRNTTAFELNLEHRAFLGPATVDVTVGHIWGSRALGATRAPKEATGEGETRKRVATLDGSVRVPFSTGNAHWTYSGRMRAQYNLNDLIPQDRFSIGGRYSVRGFEGGNSLSGERGAYLRNELSLRLPRVPHQPFLALDGGIVGGAGADDFPDSTLIGLAGGLRGALFGIQYDTFASLPLSYPDELDAGDAVYGFQLTRTF
ncbi:ShlB/FhaC/HecB family hemolysin secretion/activation protein [Natronospirillum operosum]|uniref:ShlB/FhaC/HecB family hemolysin secretion/activation protein n=2 Tax=Natronospirillum operosum TaxID=2759953 RepID=A0A4Z0WFW2_9GAMM|nr:ShlB/FhaC/HecB family hemolysin secretion/activation protein [Natronospirillum operosum]